MLSLFLRHLIRLRRHYCLVEKLHRLRHQHMLLLNQIKVMENQHRLRQQ